jgi:hypothetical protein
MELTKDMKKTTATLTIQEALENHGFTTFEEMAQAVMVGTAHAPTLCEEDCEVEPDGVCPHGHQSLLLMAGMI